MFHKVLPIFACVIFPLFLCQCVTTQQQAAASNPPITVSGVMFYPDAANQTYIVPEGAEIVGAGGNNCRFVVEKGGKLSAHSGTDNTYRIKDGGSFKGFDHPAKNCTVRYESGATLQKINSGSGVQFVECQ